MTESVERQRVLVTGAAGLVGQNLIALLIKNPALELVAIDKHVHNCKILKQLHPDLQVIEADIATTGSWESQIGSVDTLVLLHAQIGGLEESEFIANNIEATRTVLDVAIDKGAQYVVHASSSVVNSAAKDFYTESKKAQEELLKECQLPKVVLRPTLMFGWFDRKHLGWLQRFMEKCPVFPIPGHGRYTRQPLFAGDFSAIIESCIENRIEGNYNISGLEKINYIDIIREIKRVSKVTTLILRIPYALFYLLLTIYARLDSDPPFTTAQLKALIIPETFEVIDWPDVFGVKATPFEEALRITFLNDQYSSVVLEF